MHALQRRTFLKFAGLGLSLPLAASFARMAGAAPKRAKPRMIVLFTPHGMPIEHIAQPEGDQLVLGQGPGVDILAPLQPYQEQANLFRGISYTGYDNHPAISGVLTNGAGASVENVVAKGLGSRPVYLGAIPDHNLSQLSPDAQLFHDGSNWISTEENPVRAADKLFTGTDGGDDDKEADFRKAVLGLTSSEVDALRKQARQLTRTQDKLNTHLDALQAIIDDDGGQGGSCEGRPAMPTVDEVKAASGGGSNGSYFMDHANFGKIYEAQLEIMANAIACGAADVVALQTMFVNAGVNFGFMGIEMDHHDPLSHSTNEADRTKFAQAQRWLLERFEEKVLRHLRATPSLDDPSRNALDDTLVYWCTEIADGNEHNCVPRRIWAAGQERLSYVNLMTIGGAAGNIKNGQFLSWEARPHADLLMTLCDVMGTPVADFGKNTTGLITELKA